MVSVSDHVSILAILCMGVTSLVCFGVPVGLAIFAKRRYKNAFSFIPLLAGILGFFLSQMVFRLPLIQAVLPMFGWYKQFMQMQWPYVLFLSFTAGLVEEPARFIAFTIMKKRRSFTDGLSYGIGHGGIEAILLIGLSQISNIVVSILINMGLPGSLSTLFPTSVVTALAGTPSYMFLVSGLERIFSISLHIALSLVVLKGFQVNKRALYLCISIVLHGLANFLSQVFVYLGAKVMTGSPMLGGVLFSEGFLMIVAVISVWYIVKQANEWRKSLPKPAGETV